MRMHQGLQAAFLLAWGALGVAGGAAAADPPADTAALDKLIYDGLKEMHNRAADLYNGGDPNGCYRMFQGGLLMARPLLAHRPDVQKLIDQGLQNADRQASIPQRARLLHETIEAARGKLKPPAAPKPPDTARSPAPPASPLSNPTRLAEPPAVPKPEPDRTPTGGPAPYLPPAPPPTNRPAAAPTPDTLWKRLGGDAKVTKVVDDFLTMILDDKAVNLSRGGKHKLDKDKVEDLKLKIVGYISSLSKGGVAYAGRDMKEVHKDMGIQGSEFDAFTSALQIALERNGIAAKDVKELMDKIKATRKDVVAPGGDGR